MKKMNLAVITTLAITVLTSNAFAQTKESRLEPVLWELKIRNDAGTKIIEGENSYQKRLARSPLWTAKLYEIMQDKNENLILLDSVPEDVTYFCPKYKTLSKTQRMNFWAQMVASISYKESGWQPVTRSKEPVGDFPKGDSVTGQPVYSEGLLQLSYQDVISYRSLNCGFDWSKDKHLDPKDSQKTIFAPYRNLRCGLLILNNQVKRNNKISTKGAYWSVIRPRATNKYSKTPWISQQTKSLSFCK